jgi:hypothetical protein
MDETCSMNRRIISNRKLKDTVDCVRFQVLTAASMMFRVVFWVILPCKMIVDRRFSITQKTTMNTVDCDCLAGLGWLRVRVPVSLF